MSKNKVGMIMVSLLAASLSAQADSITHRSTTVDMDFVPIGYVGNTNSSIGYGAVSYSYQIGKYEVTADQWADVIADDARVGNAGEWTGSQPTAKSSWYEAARFCNWLTTGDAYNGVYTFDSGGNLIDYDRSFRNGSGMAYVLPTENEWYKAAYYGVGGYSLYANGSDTVPGLGTDANYDDVNTEPWAVGTGSEEQNHTFDMMGNVWEWTEGAEGDDFFDDVNFWGGSYYRSDETTLQSGDPSSGDPILEHDAVGFRVAAIPEPGTISLMSLSTLSLFFTRSIRRRKMAGQSLIPIRAEYRCDAFCSSEEWEAAMGIEQTPGSMTLIKNFVVERAMVLWALVHTPCKELDKRFWNHMVAVHERRVMRRKAFMAALKKRIVNGFDSFLAFILR